MFTARQLYAILVNKDDTGLWADGQPKNRAATLLYALWEGYRDRRPVNQSERDFASALDRMMDASESSAGFLKGVPGAEDIFASTFGGFVYDFRRAYDDLPNEIKEQDKINQIVAEVNALSARKAAEDEKAACGLDGSRSVTVSYRKAVSTEDSEGNTTATNYLDTSYTLLFGDETESGVTCSPMTSTMIYTVSADTASSLLSYAAGTDSEP